MVRNEPQLWCDWTKRNSLVWWITVSGVFTGVKALSMASMGIKTPCPNLWFWWSIPADLGKKLKHIANEIIELRQPHERYFQLKILAWWCYWMDESIPNAFMIASQDEHKFNDYIHQLAIGFEHWPKIALDDLTNHFCPNIKKRYAH